MPDTVVALVSADDYESVVRVHADRLHDLLRRMGCDAGEAAELVEATALLLLRALLQHPERVVDMVGWWFAEAVRQVAELGRHGGLRPDDDVEPGRGVLAGTEGEAAVRVALSTLPPPERLAVVLRDAYDLPPGAVAVALATTEPVTASLVASGRRRLLAAHGDPAAPALPPHAGQLDIDDPALARLADGTLPPGRAAVLRRHLHGCPTCESVTDGMSRARRLLAALPVLGLDEDERDGMLARVGVQAQAGLPTHEEVLLAAEADEDTPPLVPPLVALAVVVAALVAGVLVAVLTREPPAGQPPAGSLARPPAALAAAVAAAAATVSDGVSDGVSDAAAASPRPGTPAPATARC